MIVCRTCGKELEISHLDITEMTACGSCGTIPLSDDVAEAMSTPLISEISALKCEICRRDMVKVDEGIYECFDCYIVAVIDEDVEVSELIAA